MVNIDNLVEKLVSINRNTKVVTGGKNLSFSALVIVGDKKGRVGFGIGKALEVSDAKSKATNAAKKKMVKVPLKESRTVHHDYEGSFGACKVVIRSAPNGTGVISGGVQRSIFEALGIKDIIAKTIGTGNPYNVVLATFKALQSINSPKNVADRRRLDINEVIKRRNKIMKGIDFKEKEKEEKEEKEEHGK
ncbi:MAG: 30S ribosomal protein S5 [Rickettsiales bacterium]|jgi:small subunit ribosomal protein S5|nr:30S ribosomal protein S5 [Rickettsiales bacterium]